METDTLLLHRPVEIHTIQLKPADFFTRNPAVDVPSMKNTASQYYEQVAATSTETINGQNGHTEDIEDKSNGINGCCGVTNGV